MHELGHLPNATPESAYIKYNSIGSESSTTPARKLIFATTTINILIPILTISATVIFHAVLSRRGLSVCTIASTKSAEDNHIC